MAAASSGTANRGGGYNIVAAASRLTARRLSRSRSSFSTNPTARDDAVSGSSVKPALRN
jgi:hypothetical protein